MSKIVLIEWDTRQLRMMTADAQGRIEDAWSAGVDGNDLFSVGVAIKEQLQQRHLGKCDAQLAVSRRMVELRELELPLTPADELPDIVRFQAPREFTQYEEDSPVDYYEISRSEQTHRLLCTCLRASQRQQLIEMLHEAGLSPKRFALRPLAAAALVSRLDPQPRLLVDVASEEVDLTLHNGHRTLSVRNQRLPVDAERGAALQQEVRRALAMGRAQVGQPIKQVVLFGTEQEHRELVSGWDLPNLEIVYLDPLADSSLPSSDGQATGATGGFASLAGLLQPSRDDAIDFLHPRQKPKQKSPWTNSLALGGVAAALLLIAAVAMYLKLGSLDRKVLELNRQVAKSKKTAEAAKKRMEHRDVIQSFFDSSVSWIDELRLASNAAKDDDSLYTKWTARVNENAGGAKVVMEGNARNAERIDAFVDNLRDVRHEVRADRVDYDENETALPYRFRQTVTIVMADEAAVPAVPAEPAPPAEASAAPVDPSTPAAESPADDPPADVPPAEEGPPEEGPPEEGPPADVPPAEGPPEETPASDAPKLGSSTPAGPDNADAAQVADSQQENRS